MSEVCPWCPRCLGLVSKVSLVSEVSKVSLGSEVSEVYVLKGAMTRHTHTIRLPLCTVSLGPRAKLLAQETKAYTLLKPWDCILDRHITMVSFFRLLVFYDSLGRMCTQDSTLRDLPERRYIQASSVRSVHLNLMCLLFSRLECHKSYTVLVCTHSSGRFKENPTNEI